jgi:hypothetical protein
VANAFARAIVPLKASIENHGLSQVEARRQGAQITIFEARLGNLKGVGVADGTLSKRRRL